jgi:hypothetical protein
MAWQTMVKELAPQDKTGSYNRPVYAFDNKIGSPQFPVSVFVFIRLTGPDMPCVASDQR